MGSLDRPRTLEDVGEGDETPLERRCRLVPQRAQHGQVLVCPGTAIGERHAERPQLRFEVADSDTDGQPPLREDVDRRELLRQQYGLALRQHDHTGDEPYPAGRRRQVGQSGQRLEAWLVRRVRETGRQGDVVADSERLEADLLSQPCPPDQRVRVGAAPPM